MSAIEKPDAAPGERAALLDVRGVATMLGCSPRNVSRLSDAGRMPMPLRLGRLVRWRRRELEHWIGAGCPDCRIIKVPDTLKL